MQEILRHIRIITNLDCDIFNVEYYISCTQVIKSTIDVLRRLIIAAASVVRSTWWSSTRTATSLPSAVQALRSYTAYARYKRVST